MSIAACKRYHLFPRCVFTPMVPGCAAAVPYNTAAAFVRFFKELREASVARGFKHFQISIDNPTTQDSRSLPWRTTSRASRSTSTSSCPWDMI